MTDSNSEGYVRFLGSYFRIDGLDRDDVEQEARIAAHFAPAGLERLAARRRVIELLRRSRRGGRPTFAVLEDVHPSSVDVLGSVCDRETIREAIESTGNGSEREALGRVLRGEPIERSNKRLGVAIWRFRQRVRGEQE